MRLRARRGLHESARTHARERERADDARERDEGAAREGGSERERASGEAGESERSDTERAIEYMPLCLERVGRAVRV